MDLEKSALMNIHKFIMLQSYWNTFWLSIIFFIEYNSKNNAIIPNSKQNGLCKTKIRMNK